MIDRAATTVSPVLLTTLRQHRLSATTPRCVVFETLQFHGPLTMSELIRAVGEQADRASVYRTVALFERLGITQRLQTGWKYRIELSNNFQPHHHHMHCSGCGQTTELPEDPALERRLRRLAVEHGFSLDDHQIELRGRCEHCRRQRAALGA